MSYFNDRLKALHITDKTNSYKATQEGHTINFKFFTETKNGDISINYLSLNGEVETYTVGSGGTRLRYFSRIRYATPRQDGKKYHQEEGTETLPFVTPELLKRYKTSEKTKTLYIVEGEFKAFAMSNFGLPTFGIGGIFNFKGNNKDELHPYIFEFCDKCGVENIVLLFDADCLKVKWEEGKDLSTRPKNFYNALNTFNEYLKPHEHLTLYFSHIVADSEDKGIDDVLYGGRADPENVIDELKDLLTKKNSHKYIITTAITGISPTKIKGFFGLRDVDNFYEVYKEVVEDHDFVYNGQTYFIDNGKPTPLWKGKHKEYVRIGIDYYKITNDILSLSDGNTQFETNLVKWSKTTIKDDFYKSEDFVRRIEKYDGFCNIPENDPEKYRQTIIAEKNGVTSKLYNRYSVINHVPAQGQWRHINNLLHHIFDYKNLDGDSLYDFALDYIQLLYTKPYKHLPILCLVSKERGTGKTTFLNLLRAIFCENMRILDSARLTSNFNDHWAGKLVVAVDESFINMDEKNGAANKLKMIATNATIPCEGKGLKATEVANISKLILCSNDEKNFVKIDKEENRYCIVKVKHIEEEQDPNLVDKLVEEIPAFLYFIKHRQLYYPEKSRLWFDERVFETEALQDIKVRTEAAYVKHIKDMITEQFYMQEQVQIKLSAKVIFNFTKEKYRWITDVQIKEWLNDNGWKAGNATNFNYATNYKDKENPGEIYVLKDTGRCYTFNIEQFLTMEEIEDFKKGLPPEKK